MSIFDREQKLIEDMAEASGKILMIYNGEEASDRIRSEWLELIKSYRHDIIHNYYLANFKPSDKTISIDTFLLMQSNLANKFMPGDCYEVAAKILEVNGVHIPGQEPIRPIPEFLKNSSKPQGT